MKRGKLNANENKKTKMKAQAIYYLSSNADICYLVCMFQIILFSSKRNTYGESFKSNQWFIANYIFYVLLLPLVVANEQLTSDKRTLIFIRITRKKEVKSR